MVWCNNYHGISLIIVDFKILSKLSPIEYQTMLNLMVSLDLNNLNLKIKRNVLAYSFKFVKFVKEERSNENLRILLFLISKKLMIWFQFSIFSLTMQHWYPWWLSPILEKSIPHIQGRCKTWFINRHSVLGTNNRTTQPHHANCFRSPSIFIQ